MRLFFTMRKIVFFLSVLLFSLCCNNLLLAQTQTKTELEEKAYNSLNDHDYAVAYDLFDQLNFKYPQEFDYKFKLGLCCLSYPEKKARAIEVFTEIKKESKGTEIDYYLGKAYHLNYKFDEAIALLQPFITAMTKSNKKAEKELLEDAKLIVSNCNNGKLLIENKVVCDIKNIGAPVNTEEDEYVPAITTDESILFFTYRGKKSMGGKLNANLEPDPIEGMYTEDVYVAYNNTDGTFSTPAQIPGINTKGNDAAIAVSPDGQTLFIFYSDSRNSGDILMSTLDGNKFSKPVPLNKNINTPEYWEGSCGISADGKFLYFSSERPGGFGGKDIWVSEKINGDWAPAKNLGPKINTKYNEDAPFIHPDGITLFFSSQGHTSIGGYDIMFSVKKDNDWIDPKNMGMPLNTTEDDVFYVINDEGTRGFFSSNRGGAGGFGKKDIYAVNPGVLGEKPVIALLKGIVYGDDKPIEGTIEVLKIAQKENIGPFLSNNITGKYLMALSPGFIYRIKVVANGYDPIEEDIDVESLNKYVETIKDFYLYSPGKAVDTTKKVTVLTPTVAPTETLVVITPTVAPTETVAVVTPTVAPTETIVADPCAGQTLPDFNPLKGKSLNDIQYYNQFLALAGDYCAQGLVYKVQIGAYRKPQNFKYNNLRQFGKAEVIDYPDGITRFTQLQFTTLKSAEAQRQKSIAKGQTDTWIVAFVNGKRYTLEELIMLDYLGKAIN